MGGVGGDMRISAHLEIAKGCGQDAEAQVAVDRDFQDRVESGYFAPPIRLVDYLYLYGWMSFLCSDLFDYFLGVSSWFMDIILRRWTDVAIPYTSSNLAVNTLI